MSTDELLVHVSYVWGTIAATPWWVVAVPLVLAQLVTLLAIRHLRRRRTPKAGIWATRVQLLSTTLGLVWSAQGMYSAAIDQYRMSSFMAAVAFTVFEAMLVNRMIKASQYRNRERAIRDRHVRWVWLFGAAMAVVVASAEGWAQVPARLVIPLLVVAGWYLDLTGDDDPAEVVETQWRWTPREVGLALRLLKRSDRDRKTVSQAEREELLKRITALARKDRISASWLNTALRRRERLAALVSSPAADPELLEQARAMVDRAVAVHTKGLLAEPQRERHEVPWPPQRQLELPPPARRRPVEKAAGHRRVSDGVEVEDVREEAVRLHRLSIADGVRGGLGFTAPETMVLFDPPLKESTAERIVTASRKLGPLVEVERVNGKVPEKL
jgi:hypothetical protein